MVLGTHALVGATLAELIPGHPLEAFCIGFAAHFLMDSIPHWDYQLASDHVDDNNRLHGDIEVGRDFYFDLGKIAIDVCVGLLLAWIIFTPFTPKELFTLLAGAVGCMLPDPLQFAYYRLRVEPLTSLQRFHMWIHTKIKLKQFPWPGATLQAIFAILLVFITSYFK